ncbi:MAG: endonuclease/exonuclease/phosphatase family protein, partial [Bacteroidota bacterium]
MTYNLRYDNPNDGENRWDLRKEFLRDQLKFFEPDVMGIQEGLKHQLDYLDGELSAYSYIGVGRDDGKEKGEYTAIFYKADKLSLIRQSTFWLSESPDEISVGWDAALERICTYALFEEKAGGAKFYVFNTHFDHRGEKARRK